MFPRLPICDVAQNLWAHMRGQSVGHVHTGPRSEGQPVAAVPLQPSAVFARIQNRQPAAAQLVWANAIPSAPRWNRRAWAPQADAAAPQRAVPRAVVPRRLGLLAQAEADCCALLRSQRQPFAAELHIRKALALDGNRAALHCELGLVLIEQGDHIRAVDALRDALQHDPEYAPAQQAVRALLSEHAAYMMEAPPQVDAGRAAPDRASTSRQIGLFQQMRGNPWFAAQAFQHSLMLRPSQPHTYTSLAVALMDLGEYEKAETALQQALVIQPDFLDAHRQLGICHLRRNAFEQAHGHFARLLVLDDSKADGYFMLGIVARKRGDDQQAQTYFAQAVADDGDHASAHYEMALLHRQHGNLPAAKQALLQAVAAQADAFDSHYLLAEVLLAQQNFVAAKEALLAANRLVAAKHMLLPYLGQAHMALGDIPKAEMYFGAAADQGIDTPGSYIGLGYCALHRADLRQAHAFFDEAAYASPLNHQARFWSAFVLFCLDAPDTAAIEFEKAVALCPEAYSNNQLHAVLAPWMRHDCASCPTAAHAPAPDTRVPKGAAFFYQAGLAHRAGDLAAAERTFRLAHALLDRQQNKQLGESHNSAEDGAAPALKSALLASEPRSPKSVRKVRFAIDNVVHYLPPRAEL